MRQMTMGMICMIEGMRSNKEKDMEICKSLMKRYTITEDRAKDIINLYDNILVIPSNG